jgi:hypothetical protein
MNYTHHQNKKDEGCRSMSYIGICLIDYLEFYVWKYREKYGVILQAKAKGQCPKLPHSSRRPTCEGRVHAI